MSTCRMASSPKDGACDANGELWECEGVFVCDGSILPTASGSNPMMTILSVTHMLMNRLVNRKESDERVKRSGGGGSSIKILGTAAVTVIASLLAIGTFKFLKPY